MGIRTRLRRVNERRRSVPMGVQLLTVVAVGSIALVAVAAFGPDLPGPDVGDLVSDGEDGAYVPCDPSTAQVREPDHPVEESGRWRREQPMPMARDELRAAAVDGRVFIVNGHEPSDALGLASLSEVRAFDPPTGEYSSAPDTPVPLDHSAVEPYRGDLYLVGGDTNGQPSGGLWRYSPDEGKWETLPSMATPRAGHAAVVIGDRLYVLGGSTESAFIDAEDAPLASIEIYDFQTGEWSRGPDMPTARHHFDATVLDGQLYAIGGRTSGDYSLDTFERFDPARDEWKRLPPLPQATSGQSVETVAGRVVVVGGSDDLEGWVTPATWAFDPEEGRWQRLPDLGTARHGQASATLGDRLYVFGGSPCAGFGRTASAESLSLGRG
jgi:Kelch motif